MRRLVCSLIGTAVLLTGVLAMVAVPAPAYADSPPLAQGTATVNPPPQPNGLLNLCVTSHSLDPSGTCITVPPTSGAPSVPGQTYGTATARAGVPVVSFQFQGQITISGHTFRGTASGSGGRLGSGATSPMVYGVMLSGTSPTGSLTATCNGEIDEFVGGAVSDLGCQGSANGGAVGFFNLQSVYRAVGADPASRATDYDGAFVGFDSL